MIAFFPESYPDELLYSRIARYHARSGYARYIFTAEDIYRRRTVRPDMEFVNAYSEDAMQWLCREQPFEEVIHGNTMYPAYARFLPQERRQKAFQHLLICEGIWSNDLAIPNTGVRYLRYCPCCAQDDREQYGETYWHRIHQIQRIQVCPEHGCYLENSEILISGKSSPDLHAADASIYDHEIRYCDNQRLIELTRYIIDVMQQPVCLDNTAPVGMFLNSRLVSKYRNDSGLVRNITQLYEDYTVFYEGVEPIMTLPQMQKVFNGYLFDNFYICQLAYFEGISVHDLTHLPEQAERPGMDALLQKLSQELGVEYSKVAAIGEAITKYQAMQSKVHKASGAKAQAWAEVDRKMLPKVKTLVDGIYDAPGRPEKVSVSKVQRLLKLPQKQIYNLPKCKAYIEQHTETQPEYWAREIVWAIQTIENSGDVMNWRHVRDLTNMKPNDLRCAIPHIKDKQYREIALAVASDLL